MGSAPASEFPTSRTMTFPMMRRALMRGWRLFVATRTVSVTYSLLFALIGLLILGGIERASVAPMMLPLAGGFMLIAPVLLCGFFAVADAVAMRSAIRLNVIASGFRRLNREIVALTLVCALLFLIWVTDAATLYGFMVGRDPLQLLSIAPPQASVRWFILWSSIMGAFLAFVIYCVAAFSLPLLYYRRTTLVRAVVLSVQLVFANFIAAISWALFLSTLTITSILFLPLFLIVFPVLAFASHALYQELFPQTAA